MSFSDVITSTRSSIVDKFVYVVNQGNDSAALGGSHYNNLLDTTSQSHVQHQQHQHTTPAADSYDSVTDGLSQGQINAVITMLISFSIFGCLGNGLVLYVFSKKSDKVSSTIFILALAWTDFFVCLLFMPFTVAIIKLDNNLTYDFFCKTFHFFNTSNVPLSAFLMVAIAVDRYFSICHPFLHVVTPNRAKASILSLVLFAFSLGSITSCMYSVYKQQERNVTKALGQVPWCTNETLDDPNYWVKVESSQHADAPNCTSKITEEVYSDGVCLESYTIFPKAFVELYQKIYVSFYIISLLSVFTLYFLIYRSVVKRRAWRRKQKSWSHSPMTMTAAVTVVDNTRHTQSTYGAEGQTMELSPKRSRSENNCLSCEKHDGRVEDNHQDGSPHSTNDGAPANKNNSKTTDTVVVAKGDGGRDGVVETSALSSAEKKTIRERRDFNFLANIRTAIMLFVVAVVFIISFLPAWLMATQIIGFQVVIFYMHFVYNVVNPVIYAFMNQSFRKELKRVFQRDCGLRCCFSAGPKLEYGLSRTGMTAFSLCESIDEGQRDAMPLQ